MASGVAVLSIVEQQRLLVTLHGQQLVQHRWLWMSGGRIGSRKNYWKRKRRKKKKRLGKKEDELFNHLYEYINIFLLFKNIYFCKQGE